MRLLRLILLIAAAACPGCGSGQPADRDDKPSLFGVERYQFGNEQDQADVRQDRPDYRPYE